MLEKLQGNKMLEKLKGSKMLFKISNIECLSPLGTLKEGDLKISESGLPCTPERGGSRESTGWCVIIGNKDAEPCEAIHYYYMNAGRCGNHADIPVDVGYFTLYMKREIDNYTYELGEIIRIEEEVKIFNNLIKFVRYHYKVVEPELKHYNMFEAAVEKCNIYYCRRAIYVTNPL